MMRAWASLLLLLLLPVVWLPSCASAAPTVTNAAADLEVGAAPPLQHTNDPSLLSKPSSSLAGLGEIVRDLRHVVMGLKFDNKEFRARVKTMEGRIKTLESPGPANTAKHGAAAETATRFQHPPVAQQHGKLNSRRGRRRRRRSSSIQNSCPCRMQDGDCKMTQPAETVQSSTADA
jgi:hypothetical protein